MKPYRVSLVVDVLVDVIYTLCPVRSRHSDFASKEARHG
jgi:xanthosine utilization system XapX-like protein